MKTDLQHAVIIPDGDADGTGRYIAAELPDGRKVFLAEQEYSQEELDLFRSEAPKWKIRCSGSRFFMADHDSGEDATGYYCNYFDPVPERAVFEDGRPVGIYICSEGIRYSGNDRSSFYIRDWGFPGADIFDFIPWGAETHVFLFSDHSTHEWKDWSLLVSDPKEKYQSYLDF